MSDQLGGGRGQVLRIASEKALRQERAQQDQGTARSRKEIKKGEEAGGPGGRPRSLELSRIMMRSQVHPQHPEKEEGLPTGHLWGCPGEHHAWAHAEESRFQSEPRAWGRAQPAQRKSVTNLNSEASSSPTKPLQEPGFVNYDKEPHWFSRCMECLPIPHPEAASVLRCKRLRPIHRDNLSRLPDPHHPKSALAQSVTYVGD